MVPHDGLLVIYITVPVVNYIARSGTRGTSRWPSRHIYHRAGCELYSTVRNTWYLTMAFSSYISLLLLAVCTAAADGNDDYVVVVAAAAAAAADDDDDDVDDLCCC